MTMFTPNQLLPFDAGAVRSAPGGAAHGPQASTRSRLPRSQFGLRRRFLKTSSRRPRLGHRRFDHVHSAGEIDGECVRANSEAKRGSVFMRKCMAPIRALIVPNGCSTVSRRWRILLPANTPTGRHLFAFSESSLLFSFDRKIFGCTIQLSGGDQWLCCATADH